MKYCKVVHILYAYKFLYHKNLVLNPFLLVLMIFHYKKNISNADELSINN